MSLNSNQAFYLLVNNRSIASMSMTLAEIYEEEKDEDGNLLSFENLLQLLEIFNL
jgi:microtubule-associated protein 1 light chain